VDAPLRAVLRNEVRLDLLCRLRGSKPLTVPRLSVGTGKSPLAVAYLIAPLETFGVIRKTGDLEDLEPLYEERLDEQPAWVREAVEAHCRDSER
jgi:hypothetical protein